MEISSSHLNFRISLVEIEELKPHEEVVDSIVKSLASDMQCEGKVRDPIIVDQVEYVILDGMHRFSALRSLNCRFVPCCLLDYDSSLVKVGSWFRLFQVEHAEPVAEELLVEADLKYSKQHVDLESMAYQADTVILVEGDLAFSMDQPLDPLEHARTAVRLEKAMVKRGYKVNYLSEMDAIGNLRSRTVSLAISLPVFSKRQIREFGLSGRLLPHKVTRHVIPSRPLGIDVPTALLHDPAISGVEAERKLGDLLAARHVERKPRGSTVGGRRYEEELLVFSS